MTLIERLNSRAWEHRQHRALREEAARRIAKLEAALAAEVASHDGWQCGNGADLGTGNCGDCLRHRASLAALGRPLPPVDPCFDVES